MSPQEVARRARDELWHQALRVADGRLKPGAVTPTGPAPLPAGAAADIDARFAAELVTTADAIVAGRWSALGTTWTDLHPAPDWFRDPATGVRSDPERYAFDLNPRDPAQVGNVKNVWELSRHHHVTQLAAAYHISRNPVYAETAARHLQSWWEHNPVLRGLHWTSGIELGIRLISWIWVRRLLDPWSQAPALFEESDVFAGQLFAHQAFLATFPSHGSSANNHLVAEEAGRFTASCAFPMFEESEGWRTSAAAALEREIETQTFASGLNRELAADYHGFVTELFLAAAIEGERAGHPLGESYWSALARMADAGAGFLDRAGREPRQGDGDDGVALQLDGGHRPRWHSLLPTLERMVGRASWWPATGEADVRTVLWTAGLAPRPVRSGRPRLRPNVFTDAGVVLLRDLDDRPDQIWCRIDSGPFGFLSIAGHAHADALSLEMRVGGVDLLADPGTYCYHVDAEWRSYFRSTRAHNTLEVGGCDQAEPAGPFNWSTHADAEILSVAGLDGGPVATWTGRHTGYLRLDRPAIHQRSVTFDRSGRNVTIGDTLHGDGTYPVRLAFHLGPAVECRLDGAVATMSWDDGSARRAATMRLPDDLDWDVAHGDTSPHRGWYSPRLGVIIPAFTLFGVGTLDGGNELTTVIELDTV